MDEKKLDCCCINLKTESVLIATLYLCLTLINFMFSIFLFINAYSRGVLINMAFQSIFIFPCLPFFIGLFFKVRHLLIPCILCIALSTTGSLIWIIVLLYVKYSIPENADDIVNLIDIDDLTFVIVFVILALVYTYFLFVTISYWWQQIECDEKEYDDEYIQSAYYPYRRYEMIML